MSSLTATEKRRLEKFFEMGGGYVLDFSNPTFEEFILDATGRKIFDSKYDRASGSKANRFRAFWAVEPDYVVARLLNALLEYAAEKDHDSRLMDDCARIAVRLGASAPVHDLDAIEPNTDERGFEVLAKLVRASIQADQPETGLDHLHTFVVRYVRALCRQENIDTRSDKPLHSLFGELLKSFKGRGLVESEMAVRILKSAISILQAFNDVRNNQSFAHDNPLLSHHEALLIFNNIASTIRFLESISRQAPATSSSELEIADGFPF